MVKCSAPLCSSSTYRKTPEITFHRFPKDENKKKLWLINMNIVNWQPNTWSVLCSKHFEKHLIDHSGFRSVLLPDAIPTIFRSVPGKQLPAAELDEVINDDEEGSSERGEQPEESRDEVSHEDNVLEHGETSQVTDLHKDVQCNECLGDIIGFRYICMQCADWDLCGACEARAAHGHHLVLRVPKPQTYSETRRMVDTIRSSISTFLQPMEEEERESYEIEVKEEADSDDDGSNDDDQLNPDPELNMYPEARTQRAMLKLTKEVQVLVNVPNSELVLDPLSSSEERAVPTTSLGQDKPKIKLKRDQSSSLVAKPSHSSTSETDQHQDTNMIKEEPIAVDYEASIGSEQNKDSYCFSVSPQTIRDDHNVPSQALKRKKYS